MSVSVFKRYFVHILKKTNVLILILVSLPKRKTYVIVYLLITSNKVMMTSFDALDKRPACDACFIKSLFGSLRMLGNENAPRGYT